MSSQRIALGIAYRGSGYLGWQSQPGGRTVQDQLEQALSAFAARPISTMCAGRTDTGVHGLNQVVHLDSPVEREPFSWVRGTNRYLPPDIAVQWAQPVVPGFHARNSARSRRYRYLLLESALRPALEAGQVGWVFRPLEASAMQEAARALIGEHDFSSFRAAECQAASPVKTLYAIGITRRGAYWCFDFHGNAFLHHMIRNIMGCLVAIGSGRQPAGWMGEVLRARSRDAAAPTFMADGLYFVGPQYDAHHRIPAHTPAMDWFV
ncbi:tRNA pseudouridine(38-40) synthase TruA [Aquabacterium sp.]|uniref:tRNA pseudouridine(38-40) synthase TruA n=1 Tax=Aquabacterium sp. TaxID=1872578 RepID=UPI0037842B4C